MTTAETKNDSSMAPPHRRQFRNFLLIKGFQLKYAAMFAGTALILSLALGAILAKTSQDVLRQSQEAVEQGRRAVATGQQLVQESQKVSAVVGLSLVKTADYADSPEVKEAFARDNQQLTAKTLEQQRALERQALELSQNAKSLKASQQSVLVTIFGVLLVLVIALGGLGIIFTHKVAGPVFKMKRHLKHIRQGIFSTPAPLRRGDELRDFFDELCAAIRSLREREMDDLAAFEAALAELGNRNEALRIQLEARRDSKRNALADE
jgi:nitrogen fixation/metabolism regulation signal transduction histidine kinase